MSKHVIAGTQGSGLWYSSDYGASWTQSNVKSLTPQNISLYGSHALAHGASTTLYLSSDYGVTWSNTLFSGENIIEATAVLSDGYALMSRYSEGMYYSEDYGENWVQSGISTGYMDSICAFENYVIASYRNASNVPYIIYSSDYGQTWDAYSTSLYASSGLALCRVNGQSISSSIIGLAVTSSGVYRSSNAGQTWSLVQSGSFIGVDLWGKRGILHSSSTPKTVYVSSDYGATWTAQVEDALTINRGQMLKLHEKYACKGSTDGLYYSDDYGYTWAQSSMIDYTPTAIAFDRSTYNLPVKFEGNTYLRRLAKDEDAGILRTYCNGSIQGIHLVETGDPYASEMRIKTQYGVSALAFS